MPKFVAPIDMTRNQILNLVLQLLSGPPSTPVEGQVYYDSTDKLVYVYDGTSWVPLAGGGGGGEPSGPAGGDLDGTYPNPVIASGAIGNGHIASDAAIAVTKLDSAQLASWFDTQAVGMASEEFVTDAIDALIASAPGTLDTLNEIAAALGDDPNFAATITGLLNALDTRVDALEAATFSADLTGGSTSEVVTHNLGTRDVVVEVFTTGSPYETVVFDVERTTTNTVTLRSSATIAASTYRVVVRR